jgi:hypothetical protein
LSKTNIFVRHPATAFDKKWCSRDEMLRFTDIPLL